MLQCEVQTTYYSSLPICWCQRPCSLCLSKCIWHECYGSHTVSDQAGELTSASLFFKVFQTLAPKLCDHHIFFELRLITADMKSPMKNFLHGLQQEHKQYFIYDFLLYVLTSHTVERRKHCCQGGLCSSVWKLSPTEYRFATLHWTLGLLCAIYYLQWWPCTSALEKKK